MRIAGIIAEYNPFHAGHAYHIAETRKLSGADVVVCVMAGEFTQRSYPAICDKWTRTRMALEGGADVVVELPFLYATQSAQGFATGGVALLSALGADVLSFGAETADVALLSSAAALLEQESERFRAELHASLERGNSYATAQRDALQAVDPHIGSVIQTPNNVLAVEYLRAMRRIGSGMEPLAVQRSGCGHHERTLLGTPDAFASSTAIRKALQTMQPSQSFLDQVGTPVPFDPVRPDDALFTLTAAALRAAHPEDLAALPDMEPGLAHRLIRAARSASGWQDMMDRITTRRYPPTRVRRVLLYVLLGIHNEHIHAANALEIPLHARVLGVRKESRAVLTELAARARIPFSARPSQLPDTLLTQLDVSACDLYGLFMRPVRPAGAHFTTKLVVV